MYLIVNVKNKCFTHKVLHTVRSLWSPISKTEKFFTYMEVVSLLSVDQTVAKPRDGSYK